MKKIAKIQSDNQDVNKLQDFILQGINPLLQNPFLNGRILQNVILQVGSNSVNHGLGRKLQGWSLVRKRATADIFDTQELNPIPDKTLDLESNAIVSVNIYVF